LNTLFEQAVSDQATTPAGADPRRSAALLMHGLSEMDRRWAWSRLEASEQAALGPLLQELRELGVPADAGWVREVLSVAAPPASPSPAPAARDDARARIAAADAGTVCELLLQEPAALVVRLMALGPWPWADQVLGRLRAQRGAVIEPAGDREGELRSAPALDQALLAQLAARLPACEVKRVDAGNSPWSRFAPLRALLRRGGR
jgi:hypothetical protein